MEFTLSVKTESTYNLGQIAELAEIVEKEGHLFVDFDTLRDFLSTIYSGLFAKDDQGYYYIIGAPPYDVDEWEGAAHWFEICAKRIREIIEEKS